MKLYNSIGPNPRLVRMFLLEKGIDLPFQEVDLPGGENRRAPYTDRNPYGQVPALELDDGTVICETTTICEYLEDRYPEPALIGSTPEERGVARMWLRRVELSITEPMGNGFRYGAGSGMFKDRITLIPQAADDLVKLAREGLAKLDGLIGGQPFIVGDRLTLADIVLYAFLDFGSGIGQALEKSNTNLKGWFDRMASRPSADQSVHPGAQQMGMRV